MFEHFGLMDVWSSIKKYKIVFCSILGVSALIFGILGLIKVLPVLKNVYNSSQDKCISSVSYYVEPIIEGNMLENTDMSFYKTLPDDYAAILNADFCRQYVYDKITDKYTNEYIVENSSLGRGASAVKASELCIMSMKELYTVGQYENTMLVNIFSETYNEQLSDEILKACEDYLINRAQPQMKNANLIYAGGAKQILSPSQASALIKSAKSDKVSYKKETSKMQTVIGSVLKVTVLPILTVIVLCCVVICLIALFNPTLNRKSDFMEYKIPILGEVENNGKIREIK